MRGKILVVTKVVREGGESLPVFEFLEEGPDENLRIVGTARSAEDAAEALMIWCPPGTEVVWEAA